MFSIIELRQYQRARAAIETAKSAEDVQHIPDALQELVMQTKSDVYRETATGDV